jgi:putative acetyltransferase
MASGVQRVCGIIQCNLKNALENGRSQRVAALPCSRRSTRTLALHTMTTTIRPEAPSDEDAIGQVTRRAFLSHPNSHQTEQFIIRALRADHALSVSLVAEDAGCIVGHIALSPVTISDGASGWYGLGPISVEPKCQRRGIRRALMERGLAELRKIGANGCVLVGDPAFYARFGFANNPALTLEGVPQDFFLSLSLGTSPALGNVQFHPAFQAEG